MALLGPNGAGKTTLVLHLNGILARRARPGRTVAGLPVDQADTCSEVRRRVGVVFQDPDDQLFMPTVGEDVAFGPRNLGLPERGGRRAGRRGARTRSAWPGSPTGPPHHLSFGQRRRVAVATVLSMHPEILVLDEPSSNLDPAGRRELAEVLESLPVTMLMVTHDLPYALQLCPRSVVLDGGSRGRRRADPRAARRRRPAGRPPARAARTASTPPGSDRTIDAVAVRRPGRIEGASTA